MPLSIAPLLFALSLCCFVAQSQLAQHLQTTLHYHKPFFTLYLSHSSLTLLFPLHLLYLRLSGTPLKSTLRHLRQHLRDQLDDFRPSTQTAWPWATSLGACVTLTALMTVPGISWYAAVPLTRSVCFLFSLAA